MYATTRGGFKDLLHPYYIVNLFLSVLFIATKKLPFISELLYDDSNMEFDDYQVIILFATLISLRRSKLLSVTDYVAYFCMFAKASNLVLFYHQSLTLATVYGVLWLIQASLLFQPVYSGPETVSYFREATFKDTVETADLRITWVVVFYAAWSPACNSLAPIFSELSHAYSGYEGLRFGKVDVGRCPNLAQRLGIDNSTWSKQLPTIIIFRGGKEVDRRPGFSQKSKKLIPFAFNWDSIIRAFDLNGIYAQCKRDGTKIQRIEVGKEKTKTEQTESKKDK
ncbi:unnamed protein product [Hymenolepis diminuta]|uniref:Thioredoxin domain-containing protein n=1 Tax=Hymenolepis diminuta TaxID=6216 RepID=A0A564Z449_HYMDI|nr:unnamed protein product [Hymenolepis diminuta]